MYMAFRSHKRQQLFVVKDISKHLRANIDRTCFLSQRRLEGQDHISNLSNSAGLFDFWVTFEAFFETLERRNYEWTFRIKNVDLPYIAYHLYTYIKRKSHILG